MAYLMLIAALLTNAEPAAPTATVVDPPTAVPAKKGKSSEKMVCRRVVPTGSIMAIRSCRSQKDWDEMTASSQDMIQTTRRHSEATMGQPD